MPDGNYIKLNRQLLEWRYWYSETAVKLWILILMKANWKDGWFMGKRIPRGSFATSISNLAIESGFSEATVRRWLIKFEEDGQITRRATNRFTQINVINYALFQDVPENVTKRMTEQMTERVTEQVTDQMTEQVTPNRRKKEGEEGKKERSVYGSFAPPTREELQDYIRETGSSVDPDRFFDYYENNGWKTGKTPMQDWRATVRSWEKRDKEKAQRGRRDEVMPDYWNADPIRDPDPKLATPEEIERVRAMLLKGKGERFR